ncbi:hypothetical protein WDU94_011135 [Cyamophila willieti]
MCNTGDSGEIPVHIHRSVKVIKVFNREGWCQTLVYLSSVFSFLSVWLIVAFTVERFIAVQYPLHRPHICTVARAKTVILCLTAASFLLHVYCFLTAGLVTNDAGVICDLREGYEEEDVLDEHQQHQTDGSPSETNNLTSGNKPCRHYRQKHDWQQTLPTQ